MLAWLRRGAVLAVLVIVVEYLVVPQLVGASRSLDLLAGMQPGWVVAGVLLEAAALFCYAVLTRTVLPGDRPRLNRLFRITLASTGASHAVPGGGVAGSGVAVKLLTADGVPAADAGFVVAAGGLWSAVVLNVLLWVALLASIPLSGVQPLYALVAVLGLLAMIGAGVLIYASTRGEERGVRVVRWLGGHIRGVGADRLEQAVRRGSEVVRRLAGSRSVLGRATLWAALKWLLDAASLGAFLAALGHPVHPVKLFVAYGIGNVLGAVPVVPGGLGIVEASTASLLTGFGVPAAVATLAVLGWRLVSFWLPIPVGGVAYASLRLHGPSHGEPRP